MGVTLMKFLSNEIPQAFNKDLNYVLKNSERKPEQTLLNSKQNEDEWD